MTAPETHANGLPAFGRIEITLPDRAGIAAVTNELRALADQLDALSVQNHQGETIRILAYHQIKAASKKLRK